MILSKINMAEVTRLTRQGRLAEAMAVLRGARLGASEHVAAEETNQNAFGEPITHLQNIDMPPPNMNGGRLAKMATISGGGLGKLRTDLLDRLSQLQISGAANLPLASNVGSAPRALPPGAKFLEERFSNHAGARTYKLYVPSGYSGHPVPLLVMLHGCNQSPDDFAAGTRMNELAEEQTFLVAYPAQAQSANASKCWNWFQTSDQGREGGEPAIIAGISRQIMSEYSVDSEKVFIAGLSAGGAAAANVAATYPDLYFALGVHSGLACGAASDLPSAFTAMREGAAPLKTTRSVRAIVFHGDTDMTVNLKNADQVMTQARGGACLDTAVERGETHSGIRYTREIHKASDERTMMERWTIHNVGHAWSGGSPLGSYTEPNGPDASREMLRFFLE
jgi:poly(hydroxyalkanoate) depolymerase family esterase